MKSLLSTDYYRQAPTPVKALLFAHAERQKAQIPEEIAHAEKQIQEALLGLTK